MCSVPTTLTDPFGIIFGSLAGRLASSTWVSMYQKSQFCVCCPILSLINSFLQLCQITLHTVGGIISVRRGFGAASSVVSHTVAAGGGHEIRLLTAAGNSCVLSPLCYVNSLGMFILKQLPLLGIISPCEKWASRQCK